MKATVVYGTDSGNTRAIAEQIAALMDARVVEVSTSSQADFENCDLLILGTPTCGYGDLQFDWDGKLDTLAKANLAGKAVALFALGDQGTYADTFVDAMGVLYEQLENKEAVMIGSTSVEDYDFYSSRAVRDDRFVGLVVDQDIQPHMTDERIEAWVTALKASTVATVS